MLNTFLTGFAKSAGGGLLSGAGGLIQNAMSASANKKAMKHQFRYNLALQNDAQDWQEHMSNTAHTREVDDLYNAGLNPILSATGGSGASTGSAGMNSVSAMAPQISNPLEYVGQALSLMNNTAQIDQMKAQTDNLRQNTDKQAVETFHEYEKINKTLAEKQELLSRSDLNKWQAERVKADIQFLEYQKADILSNISFRSSMAHSASRNADANVMNSFTNQTNANTTITNAETNRMNAETNRKRLGIEGGQLGNDALNTALRIAKFFVFRR